MGNLKMKSDPVKTVLVITVGFLVIYILTKLQWVLYTAIVIGILGVVSEYIAQKIEFVWMKIAWILSFIVPNILLSTVFYLFLTPIALVSRVFGEKNQLNLKDKEDSLFKNKDKAFDASSFDKPW